MKLRIKRTWKWVTAPGAPLIIGGPAQLVLEPTDVLEAFVNGEWEPVPVEEGPKPEHPAEAARRQEFERLAQLPLPWQKG